MNKCCFKRSIGRIPNWHYLCGFTTCWFHPWVRELSGDGFPWDGLEREGDEVHGLPAVLSLWSHPPSSPDHVQRIRVSFPTSSFGESHVISMGAAIGGAALGVPIVYVAIVSFGIVALLFLVCNELLIEAKNAQGNVETVMFTCFEHTCFRR